MRSTLLLVPVAGLVLAFSAGPGYSQEKGNKEDIGFETFDGVMIKGSFYPSAKDAGKSPVVMLMHKYGSDRSKGGWDDLASHLQAQGYCVLSFDFRGHGGSTQIRPEKFWKYAFNAQNVKHSDVGKKTISFKEFSPSGRYFPWLVNDIVAARYDLDNRNDNGQCNTSNIIVIAAEEAGPLAFTWMAFESARQANYKMPNLIFGSSNVNSAPGSDDIAGAIWLSFTRAPQRITFPYNSLTRVGYDNATKTSPLRDHIPMWFAVGQTDKQGLADTDHMYDSVMKADKKTNQLELTFKKPIANMKLRRRNCWATAPRTRTSTSTSRSWSKSGQTRRKRNATLATVSRCRCRSERLALKATRSSAPAIRSRGRRRPPRLFSLLAPTPPGHTMNVILDSADPSVYDLATRAAGPAGGLPLTEELLRHAPSGDLFGWTQNVGMGLSPLELGRKEFLILSHPRRPAGRRRLADRPRLSLRALGSRPAGEGGGRGVAEARHDSRSPVPSPTRAMAVRRARRACSTACRTATMPRRSCAG